MSTQHPTPTAAELLGPGGAYELVETDVNGVRLPIFKNAPVHLREYYQAALEWADETFYVYEDERYTFADAWQQAERVAGALRDLGVKPGDTVGIAMRNYPEWVWAYMGITALGAVVVAMNAWWSGEEMIFGIHDSGLKTIFVDRERLEHLSPYLDEQDLNVIAVRTPHTSGTGVRTWEDFVAASDGLTDWPDVGQDDHAMILYTSGSTAHPKGAVSSHRAIIHCLLGWEAGAALARAKAGRPQRPRESQPSMILTVPLFHVTGLNGQLLPSFGSGRKVVGMYKWEAEKALAIIEREGITHFSGVPTMAYELVNSPNYDNYDLSSLRSIGGGGAAMTPKHSQCIDERSQRKTRASAAYGMTETNGLAASNAGDNLRQRPTGWSWPAAWESRRRARPASRSSRPSWRADLPSRDRVSSRSRCRVDHAGNPSQPDLLQRARVAFGGHDPHRVDGQLESDLQPTWQLASKAFPVGPQLQGLLIVKQFPDQEVLGLDEEFPRKRPAHLAAFLGFGILGFEVRTESVRVPPRFQSGVSGDSRLWAAGHRVDGFRSREG